MLNNLKRLLRGEPDKLSPMWIDRSDATSRLARLSCSPVAKQALADLIANGVAVLPGANSEAACDALIQTFTDYCVEHEEHKAFQDKFGLHDRLANLHLVSPAAQSVALNPQVLEILDCAFRAEAGIVGSLFFERGSTQDIHRDTPAFYTYPLNHYFGVWHALEDVHADAGPLTYYLGGHKAQDDARYIGSGKMDTYFADVIADCKQHGMACQEFLAKKGDTLIWHPQLPHGGAQIRDPARSRRSIVFHYKPVGVPIYGPDDFFGDQKNVTPIDRSGYLPIGPRKMFDQGAPRFFLNRQEGNFDEV